MNTITMKLQADHLIEEALREDISSEDVTTNSVMKKAVQGEVNLICKQDGIIAGLEVFKRVFELLDANTKIEFYKKDGDAVKSGELLGVVTGDIRVLLSGERVALNYTRILLQNCLPELKRNFWIQEKQLRICVFSKNMQFASEADIITAIIYLMASF